MADETTHDCLHLWPGQKVFTTVLSLLQMKTDPTAQCSVETMEDGAFLSVC